MNEGTLARFKNKYVLADTGCWIWTGAISRNGYGSFRFNGKTANAHRVAYAHFVGPIPDGLDLDHLCRVRNCVNPAHLEPVTRKTNLARGTRPGGYQRVKTHCPAGHPYDDANTYACGGSRHCRKCHAALEARRRQKR